MFNELMEDTILKNLTLGAKMRSHAPNTMKNLSPGMKMPVGIKK
jgi:hypothetical protein